MKHHKHQRPAAALERRNYSPNNPMYSIRKLAKLSAIFLVVMLFAFTANTQAAGGANNQAAGKANNKAAGKKGKLHTIELSAERLDGGMFAYQMNSHTISDMSGPNEVDVTNRYSGTPTIPGPTIVINEGDEVALTLVHAFDPGNSTVLDKVSVHVHGVHYDILSDGTIKDINLVEDESAIPSMEYTYHWVAAPGTAGTWAYHDHNMMTLNGAEDRGLYGALIVNNQSTVEVVNSNNTISNEAFSSIEKEYVLFIGDDAFWGMEINNQDDVQTPLGYNPALSAQKDSNVRVHLISLGTNFHQFGFSGYKWVDPGTNLIIQEKEIGPLEKHVFTIRANHNSVYKDQTFTSMALGMQGNFTAIP